MPSREEIFNERFTSIMASMRVTVGDPEAMWLLGSLAARIIDEVQASGWSVFKARLTAPAYDGLLKSFQSQGNALAQQGAHRQVHAIEVLAISLIAKTQLADPAVVAGNAALDQMIDDAIAVYRNSRTADPIIS